MLFSTVTKMVMNVRIIIIEKMIFLIVMMMNMMVVMMIRDYAAGKHYTKVEGR